MKCKKAADILSKLDQEKAANEEQDAIEESVKKEYQDCISSFGKSSCSEELTRKKVLSGMGKETTSASNSPSVTTTTQKKETSSQKMAEANGLISEETIRKAKACQSKGGVWVNDQCILTID